MFWCSSFRGCFRLRLPLSCAQPCLNFAVTPVTFEVRGLVSLGIRAMGSKRPLSNSSSPVSPVHADKQVKKLKGSANWEPSLEEEVVKENEVQIESDEIRRIRDDPTKLESMTVQQLRTTLRSVGVSTKGRKTELVSALKCFMDNKIDVKSSSTGDAQQVSSSSAENISAKTMDKSLSDEDHAQVGNTVLEVSRLQRSKREVKKSSSEGKSIKVDTKVGTAKQKKSIKTDKISGTNGADISTSRDEPWVVLAHKKPKKEWIPYNPRTMRPTPLTRDTEFVKLLSWNVNGLRALLKSEGFSAQQLAEREDFDVLCLQETKIQEKDVDAIRKGLIPGYENCYWTCSVSKLGYSGTAIISRIKPLSVKYGLGISDHDSEGRLVTVEFDSFYLICGYIPNSGDGLGRLSYRVNEWDIALGSHMKELKKSKPVILTGDLNCAHEEIDIYDPTGNKRSAGFTIEERQSFEANFLSKGFVDTFRKQHPDVVGYTYWGYRHGGRKTNKGWRLDYFLVSESIADKVHDSYILPDVPGSDHCPIGLVVRL